MKVGETHGNGAPSMVPLPSKCINCPMKCEEWTDCNRGLPKKCVVLMNVIIRETYTARLDLYYK